MAEKKQVIVEEETIEPITEELAEETIEETIEEPTEEPTEEVMEEVVEESTKETPIPVSRSRSFMMAKYPDKTYETEEDYENDLADYLETTESDLNAYRESDEQLSELLEMNPELALMVRDMKEGAPFMVALARNVDLEDLAPIEGEVDFEEYSKELTKRKEDNKAKKAREAELAKNAELSGSEMTKYLESLGWNAEKRADFDAWLTDLLANFSENKIGKREMDIFLDAYQYAEAIARAKENGRIEGRNQKIEAKRKVAEQVDTLPEAGAASKPETKAAPRQVIDIKRLLGQ
jgi:hypothetical protein